jgi:hypothetical protein
MARPIFCHPERSEGSQALENSRFFAALRMTTPTFSGVLVFYFFKELTKKAGKTGFMPEFASPFSSPLRGWGSGFGRGGRGQRPLAPSLKTI